MQKFASKKNKFPDRSLSWDQREYFAAILSTSSLCLLLNSSTESGCKEPEALLTCRLILCLTTVISETPTTCKNKKDGSFTQEAG